MTYERKERLCRTERLLGEAGLERLAKARVAVFGLGGVGGHLAEALARSGIGALDLIDHDVVSVSNLNRQLFATVSTIGRGKAEVAAERIRDVAPDCIVRTHPVMFLPETADEFDFASYDYVADAIDTVTGKLALIETARAAGTKIISSMGAGNRLDAGDFQIMDLYETRNCPLAKIMRKECRRRGIESLKVVCADSPPLQPISGVGEDRLQQTAGNDVMGAPPQLAADDDIDTMSRAVDDRDAGESPTPGRRAVPGSVAFVPSVAGLLMAGEIVRDLTQN